MTTMSPHVPLGPRHEEKEDSSIHQHSPLARTRPQTFLALNVVSTKSSETILSCEISKRPWCDIWKDCQSPRSLAETNTPGCSLTSRAILPETKPTLREDQSEATSPKKRRQLLKSEESNEPPSSTSRNKIHSRNICQESSPYSVRFAGDRAPEPLISVESKRVLVLDNDETTGYYQLASLLFAMHLHLTSTPPPRDVICKLLRTGAIRPGAVELLRLGAELKANGRLDHLIVFTAASDSSGWVTHLVSCLEEVSGIPPGSIDTILSRKHASAVHPTTGHVVKDLRRICGDPRQCCIVDDKPHLVAAHGGNIFPVRPYEQHVPIEALIEQIPCSREGKDLAFAALREDSKGNKPPSPHDFSGDRELFSLLPLIEKLFP